MNNDFGALTILAPKCQKCPKVETCDHKQLAHLGYIIPIEDTGISMVVQRGNGKSLRQLEIIDSLMKRKYGEVMRIVLLASIILQAIAIGMSFAENIGEEKQRIIRYTGWFLLLIYMIFG